MVDYMRGRWPPHKPLPIKVVEYLIARRTGWRLEYIRELAAEDFEIFRKLVQIEDKLRPKGPEL